MAKAKNKKAEASGSSGKPNKKNPSKADARSGSQGGDGTIMQAAGFFQDSVEELKKVTTPTRQETIQATLVTLIIMVFVALCLFLLDFLFGNLMESVLKV